jgi:biopolymer transport protein ExbD
MPKIKVPRKSTAVDMTAMCDVAFLLLTFFILTTKFKPQEAVQIDIPASTAQIPLPDKDILKFDIAKDGRVFFGVDDQNTRLLILDEIEKNYKLSFTPEQKDAFRTTDLFGMDLRSLPEFLSKEPNERAKIVQPGIKMDTIGGDRQLVDLIYFARFANPKIRIAIKGDKATEYKNFDKIIKALQDNKANKFNIITSGRSGGS